MADMIDYRRRIYSKYASCFQDSEQTFDVTAANKWGKAYDSYLKGWLPSQKNANILEIACGSGRLLHFFKARKYTNITGVDISPEQVQLAKKIVEAVVQADILKFLENVDKTYDLIIGLDIIEHLQKDEVLRFLDACYKALKPEGRIILQTPNTRSPFGPSIFYGDFTHEVCFNTNSLGKLFKLVGFQHAESREAGPVIHGFASALRYVIWQGIRIVLKIWNLAETGNSGSGVFTRVFLISGLKPTPLKEKDID
jgi:2-polyprenyl-3-methyl-5-hydroxy-6-metoxy-1,4-benzoquinol methylase